MKLLLNNVPFEPCFTGNFDMYKDYLEEKYFESKMMKKAELRKRKAERLSETVVVLKQEDQVESIKKRFQTFKEQNPDTDEQAVFYPGSELMTDTKGPVVSFNKFVKKQMYRLWIQEMDKTIFKDIVR